VWPNSQRVLRLIVPVGAADMGLDGFFAPVECCVRVRAGVGK
jgi:hypothetical protein